METIRIGGMEMTREQAQSAGLLPEQSAARHTRQLETLQRLGLGETREARALHAAATRKGN